MKINNLLLSVKPLADQLAEGSAEKTSAEHVAPSLATQAPAQDDDRPPVVFRRKLPKIRIGPKRYGCAY